MQMNCWEYKKCGREKDGVNSEKLGVCPAYLETRLNYLNSGNNGGRSCWLIAGTFCNNTIQGTYASKIDNCEKCKFYQKVLDEQNGIMSTAREIRYLLENE